MHWFLLNLWSSIGKKLMMALTGLAFCGFLASHLVGNLSLYGGRDAFEAYAETLHKLGPLITLMEWALLIFALIHIGTGLTLFYQNFNARPGRYVVNKRAGGRTTGSATMPYTGIILLVFVILHLINFHFVDKTDVTIYQIVRQTFENPLYVIIYIAAMAVAAVHVSHGFWSAFQTIGVNHPKYMPLIMGLSIVFSLAVGFGFGLLPIYVYVAG